jgi:hypothetical protein
LQIGSSPPGFVAFCSRRCVTPGGTNLAIFPANLVDGDHVTVHDPEHRLLQDQSSWP